MLLGMSVPLHDWLSPHNELFLGFLLWHTFLLVPCTPFVVTLEIKEHAGLLFVGRYVAILALACQSEAFVCLRNRIVSIREEELLLWVARMEHNGKPQELLVLCFTEWDAFLLRSSYVLNIWF